MKRLTCLIIAFSLLSSISFSEDPRPKINASDVVFMYIADPVTQYDDYAGTVVGWGGRPRNRTPQAIENFRQAVDEAHKRGMRFCASVDFLVDFAGFIDFAPDTFMEAVCRDLEGKPLQVPWLWDHKHKGNPSYWFCFNHPMYQKYLLDQVERACQTPINGLHIDDYAGTSHCSEFNGGCFCSYCMTGFRDFLQQNFSSTQLKEWGIESLDSFDYGIFLKARGFSADDYKHNKKEDPLRIHFQNFQNEQMKQRIAAVYEYAEKLRGIPLVRSVNSSASSPRTIIPSPIIDYFCGECGHHAASTQVSNDPVFVYRMVETLGDRQTATASGQDWAWIKANDKPGLVRTWIAQAYAYGSVFMVPHRQWCYTEELGTHWWNGKVEDFAYLYRFVRENASLLDDFISLANIAVLCSNSDFHQGEDMADLLGKSNIPSDLLYTPTLQSAPTQTDLSRKYEALLVSSEAGKQAEWLKNSTLPIIEWNGMESIPHALKPSITADKVNSIRISFRYKPMNSNGSNQTNSPVVCHVLNQNYSVETDSVQSAPSIKISFPKNLLKKTNRTSIQKAIVHEPQKEIRTVSVTNTDSDYSFTLENLGLWAIVELQ